MPQYSLPRQGDQQQGSRVKEKACVDQTVNGSSHPSPKDWGDKAHNFRCSLRNYRL